MNLTNITQDDVLYTNYPAHGLWCLLALAIIQGLILVGSLVGNLVVFVVFHKKQNLLTPSNRLICNLALANCLMAVFVMPAVLVSFAADRWLFGDIWCKVVGVLTSVLFSACIFTLVMISLDRYCAIVTPLRYSSRVTRTRTHVALVLVWALSVLISLPPLFGWSRFSYQSSKHTCTVDWKKSDSTEKIYTLILTVVCFLAPFIIMLWAYVTIFCAAKANHQRTRRRSSISQLENNTEQSKTLNGVQQNGKAPGSRRSSLVSAASSIGQVFRKDEWKAAKTSLVIVFAFSICWIPYFAIITLNSVLHNPQAVPWQVESFAVVLMLLDCLLNPCVYVFRNKVMWDAIRTMLCRRKPKFELGNGSIRNESTNSTNCTDRHAARFSKRSMSEPAPMKQDTLKNDLACSDPVLLSGIPEEPTTCLPFPESQLWVYMERRVSQKSVKSVSFLHGNGDLNLSAVTSETTLRSDLATSDTE